MVGIYKITSPTNKVYIGQSYAIEGRFSRYKRLTCPQQTKLHHSLVFHGSMNHKYGIIHELPKDIEPSILDIYEQLYIEQYKECGFELLNLQSGGSNGRHSEESKEKIRKANTGKVFTKERCENIRKSLLGKTGSRLGHKATEETRKKISESKKGKKLSPENAERLRNLPKGRVVTQETRSKLSAALKGRKLSPEHLAKTRRGQHGEP